ncbi:MAG: YgcG family protein [Burkholderiaceae bacterium]|nr:YgcG family protein [Burkholderiaceae bacterium]
MPNGNSPDCRAATAVQQRFWLSRAVYCVLAVLLLAFSLTAVQAAPLAIPPFTGWVVDQTNTLDASTKAELEQRLAELDKTKGAQVAVLVVPTTGEDTIESYAVRAFQQWRLGRKSVDDGVLLVVAKDDRKLRIETGYGLEGAITDLSAGRIIREQITPRFRVNDYAGGIVAGVDSLVALVNGEDLPAPVASSNSADQDESPWFMVLPLLAISLFLPVGAASLFVGVFAGIAFGSLAIGIAVAIGALILGLIGKVLGVGGKGNSGRASRRGGALGGLGGGGFGGGFGGGGGGSSGGGGASGSW